MMACRCVECRRSFPIGQGKNGLCRRCQEDGLRQSLLFKLGNNRIISGKQFHRNPDEVKNDEGK